ncbi:MAG TPA: helix-turn-helix domain-containing protein [Solirubrobacteraceae bacterium]|nr:helix-turn-helix domain-containing protein [Solirubrobacteraceae bacterium]
MSKLKGERIRARHSDNSRPSSLQEVRAGLAERLRTRRPEIERAVFAHARAVSDLPGSEDAEYVVGLRAAVAAALDYTLTGIERGEQWPEPIPSVVVAQAHRAARNGVDLETVLLRCAAGQRVLVGFLIVEADGLPSRTLAEVLDLQGLLVERLMASVSMEHKRELKRARRSPAQRHAELVQRLLAGENLGLAELGYHFDAWHIGLIATGKGATETLRVIAASADRQLLSVSHGEETVWAWLGGTRRLAVGDLERLMPLEKGRGVSLAIGEPGSGIDGWRLTHHQAQAALLVALHRPRRLTRYAEDMLLAIALRDETLACSLKEIFLSPLRSQRDGGATLLQTLRVYLANGCNASKAGTLLGVTRHTVENRIKTAEQHLGRALDTCQVELQVALRLDELEGSGGQPQPCDD